MPNCQAIKTQLDLMKEERQSVVEQLHESHSPRERAQLLAELKSLNQAIALKQQALNNCLHPPAPRPDLVAKSFQIRTNHQAKTLSMAGVIQNDGDGPAHGPFVVTLGVSYIERNGSQITRQLDVKVPVQTTIEGHGTQFVTEAIQNINLLYRTENPKFIYDFDMIVDSANQVSEVTESNNVLHMRFWTVPPPA